MLRVLLLAAGLLLAGCVTSGSRALLSHEEPIVVDEQVALDEGVRGVTWQFRIDEPRENGTIRFWLEAAEDADIAHGGDWCMRVTTPLTQRHLGACGATAEAAEVNAPLKAQRVVVHEFTGSFPVGHYLFTFDASPQLNTLRVWIDVPAPPLPESSPP